MKRFIARIALEFAAILAAAIVAAQLVKSGYLALGVSILSIYAMFSLYRLGIEKINAQRERGLKAALVDAASEALWVSDIEIRDSKVVYKIDAPGRGRIVIYLPIEKDAKNEDAPAASNKG